MQFTTRHLSVHELVFSLIICNRKSQDSQLALSDNINYRLGKWYKNRKEVESCRGSSSTYQGMQIELHCELLYWHHWSHSTAEFTNTTHTTTQFNTTWHSVNLQHSHRAKGLPETGKSVKAASPEQHVMIGHLCSPFNMQQFIFSKLWRFDHKGDIVLQEPCKAYSWYCLFEEFCNVVL